MDLFKYITIILAVMGSHYVLANGIRADIREIRQDVKQLTNEVSGIHTRVSVLEYQRKQAANRPVDEQKSVKK